MGRTWLNIASADSNVPASRFELKQGLTVLGGARGDLPVATSGNDCVHLWSEPPKLIFVGGDDPPRVNGKPMMEGALHSGDRIEWRGLAATFGAEDSLAEIPASWLNPTAEQARSAPDAKGAASGGSPWPWVKAGLAAELSLAEPDTVQRWQDAANRGEFNAEAAAREILAATPSLGDDDPRLRERSSRLMRELLAGPAKRAPRQAKESSRGCFAVLLSQLLMLVLVTLIVIAALLVARTRYGQSIDEQLDRIIRKI